MRYILLSLFFITSALAQLSPGDGQYYIGNTILKNPSYESGLTGWTTVNGSSVSTSTTDVTDGKKSFSSGVSGGLFTHTQCSTVNASSLAGQSGFIAVDVKTALTDVQVCSYVDNAEVQCKTIEATNAARVMPRAVIPTVFGSTCNGYRIKTTSTTSASAGAIKADSGVLIPQSVLSAVINDTARTTYTPTLTGFGTATSVEFYYSFSGDYIEIQGNFIAGTTTAVEARISLPSGLSIPTFSSTKIVGKHYSNVGATIDGNILAESNQTYLTFARSFGTNSTVAKLNGNSFSTGERVSIFARIPVANRTSTLNAFIQANANYDWINYSPATTGLGTVSLPSTNYCKHRRVGANLEVECSFTTGTVTAALASIALPSGLSMDAAKITATNTTANGGQALGFWQAANAAQFGRMVTATGTSTTLMYFGGQSGTGSSLTPVNGSAAISGTPITSVRFSVPILGWFDSGYIVGSFQGYNYTPGETLVNTGYISFGTTNATTVCSASPCTYIDQIGNIFNATTGVNWVNTGDYTINTTRTYSRLKCVIVVGNSAVSNLTVSNSNLSCSSCNQLSFKTVNGSGADADAFGTISCKGTY